MNGATPKREVVPLLDLDEELADAVPEADRAVARRVLRTEVRTLEPGETDFHETTQKGLTGLLILEGFMTRDVVFAGEHSRELLGTGDLLRPWDVERDFFPPFSDAAFSVMEPTRLALLDERHLRAAARWPEFLDELLRRTLYRARWLAIRLAINGVVRIDERLNLFFWHAAGRWGRVTPQGVGLPFRLTHETLAELIGAQRPSVTTALTALRRDGKIAFEKDIDGETRFILLGDPPGDVGLGDLYDR